MDEKIKYTFWPFLLIVMALGCFVYEFNVGFWTLLVFAVIIMGWIVWGDLWHTAVQHAEAKAELSRRRTEFAQAIATLSPDRYSALGLEFPELEIEFEAQPIVRLRGTNILLDCFQKFLYDSTETDFASVRLYNEDKTLQERFNMSRDAVRAQWYLTVKYLEERGHLTPNSAAGNHSYLWMQGSRKKFVRWFGGVDLKDFGTEAQ